MENNRNHAGGLFLCLDRFEPLMNTLWSFDEVERDDANRATQLSGSPGWPELIRETCDALRVALRAGRARFGFDESSCDPRDLWAIVQFPVGNPPDISAA
jgi:hypothetical protein